MTPDRQFSKARALGKIEEIKQDMRTMSEHLSSLDLWRPATGLKKLCDEVGTMIEDLRERFERKLVVTLIGPSGSGKSTLLNALSGRDDLSESGHKRPTTRNVVVFCKERSDARQLSREIGQENVMLRPVGDADSLEHVMLIDTPDTDSTDQQKHIPMVRRAISLSDVLICLFDAENPKRRDYVDFLNPYVRIFQGEALLVVLNKCDRQDEEELKNQIVPDFENYLAASWDRPVTRLLCISARSHLKDPGWDPQAKPRHEFDQFGELKNIVFGEFNRPGFAVDRRVENALSLKEYVMEQILREAREDSENLSTALEQVRAAEKEALSEAVSALCQEDSQQILGVNVLLYQKLAQKWMGPVGWLIAIWARILIFGTGITAIFRFGNPIRQIMGIASSIMHFKSSRAAVTETGDSRRAASSLRQYRLTIMKRWPQIAESMVSGRFDQAVRDRKTSQDLEDQLSDRLSQAWIDALESAISQASNRLSGLGLQLFFNLPSLAILAHAGYLTAKEYLGANYLTSDFFLHAFLTLGFVLFLSFFIFQAVVRVTSGPARLTKIAFEKMRSGTETISETAIHPAADQISSVLNLASIAPSEKGSNPAK